MSSPASRSLLRLGTRIVLGASAAMMVSAHPLHGDGELPRFDPDCPKPLLRWHLGEADSIVRIGNRIAVAGSGGGATAHASIFDASDPLTPRPVRTLDVGSSSWLLAASDTHFYAGMGDHIIAIEPNAAHGTEPVTLPTASWGGVYISHTVGAARQISPPLSVVVVDFSAATNPVVASVVPMSLPAAELAICGANLVTAHHGNPGTVSVRPLTDPYHPGDPVTIPVGVLSDTYGLACDATTIWMALPGPQLTAIDITDPDVPVAMPPVPLPRLPLRMALQSGRLALIGTGGLDVFDVSDPAGPALLGSLPGSGTGLVFGETTDIAYVVNSDGLLTVSLVDPGQPVVADYWHQNATWQRDVEIVGDQLWLTTQSGAMALDISDIDHPRGLGTWGPEWLVEGIDVEDNIAFIVAGRQLHLLDVSDPLHPTPVNTIDDVEIAQAEVYGDPPVAVIASRRALRTVDVSDPLHPVTLGDTWSPCDLVDDLEILGHHALIPDYDALLVFDLTNLSTPELVAELDLGRSVSRVSADRGLAAISAENGIALVDLSDPAHPWEVAALPIPAHPGLLLSLVGRQAAFSETDRLSLLDVSNPDRPTVLSQFWTGSSTSSMTQRGSRVAVGLSDWTIVVIDVGCVPMFKDNFESGGLWAWSEVVP